jgi:hypothetical protein
MKFNSPLLMLHADILCWIKTRMSDNKNSVQHEPHFSKSADCCNNPLVEKKNYGKPKM